MKQYRKVFLLVVLAFLVTFIAGGTTSAATDDLLISEYVEGSSFNKAIEIFNGTGAAVDLAAGGYTLELYSNGAATASQSVALSGTVADGDVFVLAHASADPAILAVADVTNSSVINFNGDDAVVLRKGGAVVDAFGQIGFDPGSEWPGGGQDDTLRRSADVCAGDTNAEDAFDASLEWISFAQNTFDGLGSHTADCDGNGNGDDEIPDVAISEIRIDQPGSDIDEYFELAGEAGASLDGLTYLVIGDGSGGSGVIENVTSLSGHTLDSNGFFVAAESSFTLGTADLVIDLNFENSDNVTHLLVAGFSGADGDDLDTDDDGALDVTPWSEALDLIALVEEENPPSSTEYHYGPPSVGPDGSFVPGHAFNCDGVWLIGDFGGGADTPGAANACPAADVAISEIRIDQPGGDDDEYFELAGEAGASLDGLTYLVIGDGSGGSGVIENVTDLSGQTIGSSGFFVAAESTFTLGTADLVTNLNFENGDNVTHLLVDGFSGASSDDLDIDDDGTLDVTPWAELVDLIALVEEENPPSGTEYHYGPPSVGPDGSFVPGHAYLCEDGWRIGDFGGGDDTPGAENACGAAAPIEAKIHEVQGSGDSVAITDPVLVEAIVVGDFQGENELSAFFIQEEDADVDGDPDTSEGIMVYCDSCATDVAVGDLVQVTGQPEEFFSMSQIDATVDFGDVSIVSSGNDLPIVTEITLPAASFDGLEKYEGMYVTFPQELVISEFFNFDRFGEIVLSTERQFQPTAIFEPGSPEAAQLALDNALSRITLDDGRDIQNPDPAIHPNGEEFTLDNRFRGGDTVQNATGALQYAFGRYRLHPTEGADYTAVNARPDSPVDVGGNLQVVAFNVLNYFNTIDDGEHDICGPLQNLECRGADNEEERIRQLDKIVSAMVDMEADVLGIIEVENTAGVEAMADIVDGLNAVFGPETYAYVDTGTVGTDAIKVGFIYNTTTVSLVGEYAVLDTPEFLDPNDLGEDKNRAALAQTFIDNETGGIFTAVVNHLKSKGSSCGEGDDDPEAGSCNLTRTLAAQELADWLATDPTNSGDEDFLIIGDLNAYDKEDPIDALKANGYADLLFDYQGEHAYSYVFDGQLGYLDYGMANADLAEEVTGAAVWHINADEPDILDYDTTFKQDAQDALYEPNAFRSSDHDPVIVGLNVCDEIAPTLSVAMSQHILWPPNHQYVTVTPFIDVADNFDTDVTVTLLSVTSNEPDNGLGDGDTPNDIVINDDGTVDLRAERSGTGDGRVYTFTYEAVDDCGNSTIAITKVAVPLDKGHGDRPESGG